VACPSKSEPLGHEAAPADSRLLLRMDHSLDFIEFIGADGVILGVSSSRTSRPKRGSDSPEADSRHLGAPKSVHTHRGCRPVSQS